VRSVHCMLLLLVAPGVLAGGAGPAQATVASGTAEATSPLSKRLGLGTSTIRDRSTKSASAASSTPSPDERWYSSASAFNQAIPRGTPYRPNDASLISALVNVGGAPLAPALSSSAVYFADADTPTVTVHVNYPRCNAATFEVPIPRGAKTPSELNPNNREPTMVVMQRRTGIEWSFYKVTAPSESPLSSGGPRCPKNGDWNATIVTKFDPASGAGGWLGLANEACCPGSASRIYYPAGLVRPRDVRSRAPTWGHALSLGYGGVLGGFVYPAKSHPGGICKDANSCVPAGARFRLDPGFDCGRTKLLVHRWERQACRTMQVYGMIVKDTPCSWPCRGFGYDTVNSSSVRLPLGRHVDGGGSYRFPFDTAAGHREMPVEMLRRFHVIDWTKWTGAEVLVGTVRRSGSVSMVGHRGRRVSRIKASSYLITVKDRSPAYGFRLIGPRGLVVRVSGKRYVGTVRRRVKLVRGTYRYVSGAGSARARATFTVT
jgi:hypothetical protein